MSLQRLARCHGFVLAFGLAATFHPRDAVADEKLVAAIHAHTTALAGALAPGRYMRRAFLADASGKPTGKAKTSDHICIDSQETMRSVFAMPVTMSGMAVALGNGLGSDCQQLVELPNNGVLATAICVSQPKNATQPSGRSGQSSTQTQTFTYAVAARPGQDIQVLNREFLGKGAARKLVEGTFLSIEPAGTICAPGDVSGQTLLQ